MSFRPSLPRAPFISTIKEQRESRSQRILAIQSVRESIVSLSGLIGAPVCHQDGFEVGRLVDVVARWSDDSLYPPVTGIVVKVGRRLAFIDVDAVQGLESRRITLRTARLDLRDFRRRTGEVTLAKDVLDHQLVDVDGVQVIRASDLYLAAVLGRTRLVGADVSMYTLFRRLLPAGFRRRPVPDRVIDWSSIQPFGDGESAGGMRLRTSHSGLHKLRPGELADLLEDLGRPGRQVLLASLDPGQVADALEEMDPQELSSLLREADPDQAARLVSSMEPDEAVDALRDLSRHDRDEILALMPADTVEGLTSMLTFDESEAGGFMTTILVTATADETVASVRARLAESGDHRSDVDGVVIVNGSDGEGVIGAFRADIALFDLLIADAAATMGTLVAEGCTVTVALDEGVDEVAAQLIEARRSSIVVVDAEGIPVGRILGDDVIDALLPGRGRFHFPRLLR